MLQMRRGSVLSTVGIVVAFLVAAPRSADSQAQARVIRIPDAPTCTSCSVVLQHITTLGGFDGPGEIDRAPISIREDWLGRFWILPGYGPNYLARVYSAKGAYVGTVGREGEGPGEFRGPAALMPLPGDSMLVVDPMLSRATVVSADLKPHRAMRYFRADIWPEFALDWPRSVILEGWIPTGKQAGNQLHRVSLAGAEPQILNSFSTDLSPWLRRHDWPAVVRAVAEPSGFWTYNEYRYRFSRWSADGKMIADFERDAPWFPRKDKLNPSGNKDTPPASTLVRIIPGDEQRVWSIVKVASPNWKRAWEHTVSAGHGELEGNSIGWEYLHDAIVEEIDLKSARVLSRTRIEKWVIGALDGGRVATYEVDSRGMPRVVIYALVRRYPSNR